MDTYSQSPPPPAGYPSSAGNPYTTSTAGYSGYGQGGYGQGGYGQGGYGQYGYGQQSYGKPQGDKPFPQSGFDVEAQQAAQAASQFADVKIRSAFVRKVFSLVFVMLAFTIGVACVFLFVDPVREYVAGYDVPCSSALNPDSKTVYQRSDGSCFVYGDGRWLFYTSWALTFVSLIALSCSSALRRRVPWNYITLAWFTGVMSIQVGCICAYWNLSVVLIAFAVTGAAVVGITLGAILIPWDFTKKANALGIVSMVVFFVALATFIVGFFWVSKWWYLALSVIIALLFAAWLWFDVQMIVGKVRVNLVCSR
jgi:FtsH-binding integral membrane protein